MKMDEDTQGKSGPRVKMSLSPVRTFSHYVLIHPSCPDPPCKLITGAPKNLIESPKTWLVIRPLKEYSQQGQWYSVLTRKHSGSAALGWPSWLHYSRSHRPSFFLATRYIKRVDQLTQARYKQNIIMDRSDNLEKRAVFTTVACGWVKIVFRQKFYLCDWPLYLLRRMANGEYHASTCFIQKMCHTNW